MTSIMWFRRDLRLRDHPALRAAAEQRSGARTVRGRSRGVGQRRPGAARLAGGLLRSLDESMGGRLCVRLGPASSVVPRMAERGRGRAGARDQRLRALRTSPRPGRGRGAAGGRRGGGDRHAVRRRAGHDHATARATPTRCSRRTARPGAATAGTTRSRRRAASTGCRPTATSGSARCSTRRCGRRPTGCRPPARTLRGAASGASSTVTSTTTTSAATTRAPTGPHGSRPT